MSATVFVNDQRHFDDVHCCHLGTAIKHPVPDRVKQLFVLFYAQTLCVSVRMSEITIDGLIWSGIGMLYSCIHMATVGVKRVKMILSWFPVWFCRFTKPNFWTLPVFSCLEN